MSLRIILFSIYCMWSLVSFSQLTQNDLKYFLENDKMINAINLKFISQVKQFYEKNKYKAAWLSNDNNKGKLIALLQSSFEKGLNEKDYQYSFIELYRKGILNLQNSTDSIDAEIRFTDAAIHYCNDIFYGNAKPSLGYDGINFTPLCYNIPSILTKYISTNFLPSLESIGTGTTLPEINLLEKKITEFSRTISASSFKEITITSTKADITDKVLLIKLQQLGIVDSSTKKITNNALKEKIKEAQQLFSLLSDGTIRSTLLQELNVPLKIRLQQLSVAINYYRWLNCFTQNQSAIVVNIPAAYLKVYKLGKVILEMKIIVGKKATPTPTLASTVTEVILYPYWHVPYSIATKELLPSFKRNLKFVNDGNYQVLDSKGSIVDPYKVNWHSLSKNYFPYIIRQSTGCDNALGLLKLNFYNPFGVYLHDTPNKLLFSMNKRYFSHGCMRMEKPLDIAHLVLKDNTIAIDTLEQKGCLRNQSPISVAASEHMPVIVWYNLAGVNAAGKIVFYEDVYEKFIATKKD